MTTPTTDPLSIDAVAEMIDTNLWIAAAYNDQGAIGLRNECVRAAVLEYERVGDILDRYCGKETGVHVREWAEKCGMVVAR